MKRKASDKSYIYLRKVTLAATWKISGKGERRGGEASWLNQLARLDRLQGRKANSSSTSSSNPFPFCRDIWLDYIFQPSCQLGQCYTSWTRVIGQKWGTLPIWTYSYPLFPSPPASCVDTRGPWQPCVDGASMGLVPEWLHGVHTDRHTLNMGARNKFLFRCQNFQVHFEYSSCHHH